MGTDLEYLEEFIDVDDLMKRCMGNIDFATHIVDVLSERCEADMREMEQALSEDNVRQVATVSHRLKGALSSAAAHGLSHRADELCNSANRNSPAEMSSCLEGLRIEWNQLASLISNQGTPES